MPKIKNPTPKPDQQKVWFSLQHLQLHHPKFPISGCNQAYFEALFREIMRYQRCSVEQFKDMPNDDRRHPITFRDAE
jgi:hypothetical protein